MSLFSGTDEGIYAWVAANYALGTLGGDPKHTTGIIELGGASAQVWFSSILTISICIQEVTTMFHHILLQSSEGFALFPLNFVWVGNTYTQYSL